MVTDMTPNQMSSELNAHRIRCMFGNDENLVCPFCKFEYVHFGTPRYISGNDDYSAKEIYDIGVKGDVIVIPFYCEDGHNWVVILGEHKGHLMYKMVLTGMQNGTSEKEGKS
jgi:hypothetical protein